MIHDISVRLEDQAIPFPGDPPFQCRFVRAIREGGSCNLSRLTMSVHRGTHVDAPLHFLDGASPLGDYPIGRFILPATVIEVPPGPQILPEHLADLTPAPRQAVLFKTDNSRLGWAVAGAIRDDYVHLTPSAAQRLTRLPIGLAGIDYPTIEQRGSPGHPVHKALLAADILILEGINLADVPPGRYQLFCLPLALTSAEGAPARAVLLGPQGPDR